MMDHIFAMLGTALPNLLLQLGVTALLLGLGVLIYQAITPFDERRLIGQGNKAAGIVFGASVLALAIPLAATLATTTVLIDIVIWGVIALVVQLVTLVVISLVFRGMKRQIEADNVAAAFGLAAAQIAVALLNAGAVAG
ncbi:DUF350 domain-containing protein [Zavarzinia sp.]|uniref:DUF350 domain-containing protein n=1 Tax=Zavarzinia sp. TaxID=2027920 RepID=UPI00356163D7